LSAFELGLRPETFSQGRSAKLDLHVSRKRSVARVLSPPSANLPRTPLLAALRGSLAPPATKGRARALAFSSYRRITAGSAPDGRVPSKRRVLAEAATSVDDGLGTVMASRIRGLAGAEKRGRAPRSSVRFDRFVR